MVFFFNSEESHCQDVCILKMTMVLTRQQAACSEGMPVLLVPSESWDVGFCVQSCVLLSCRSWEPSLYNWFHMLSLGYCRIKGDVLCPGIWTFSKELRSYYQSLMLRPMSDWSWGQSSLLSKAVQSLTSSLTSTVSIGVHAFCIVSWLEWFKWKPKMRDLASG